jgi:hypothetical protein
MARTEGERAAAARPSRAVTKEGGSIGPEPPLGALAAASVPQLSSKEEEVSRAEIAPERLETKREHALAAAPVPQLSSKEEEVSRAEMPPQVQEIMDVILIIWDKQLRMSRAEMERRLAEMLSQTGAFLGQVGQKWGACHAPSEF